MGGLIIHAPLSANILCQYSTRIFKNDTPFPGFPGDIFLRTLNLLVTPLVVCTLISGE